VFVRTQGILAGACIHFLTAALGPSFWLQESIVAGLLWQDWFLVASLGMLPAQIAYSAWCIFDSVRRVRRGELSNPLSGASGHAGGAGDGEPMPLSASATAEAAGPTQPTYYYALSRAIPLLLLLAMWWIWVVLSPSGIYRMYPRAMCLVLSFVYCKMTMLIMLAHVCGEIYHPWSKTSALLLGLATHATVNVAFAFVPGALRQYEEAVLMQCLTITGVTYLHLVYGTVSELCSALNIRCFTIKPASAAQIHAAAVARVEAIGWLTRERMPAPNPPANQKTSSLRAKSS
jgi:hypothetical protein